MSLLAIGLLLLALVVIGVPIGVALGATAVMAVDGKIELLPFKPRL